jgi:hypothetical protein
MSHRYTVQQSCCNLKKEVILNKTARHQEHQVVKTRLFKGSWSRDRIQILYMDKNATQILEKDSKSKWESIHEEIELKISVGIPL